MREKNFIKVKNLTRKYKNVVALQNVSFDVHKGEWVSIMGPSGSGKSTLLNIIGCLDTPDAGKVWVGTEEITSLKGEDLTFFRRDSIGLVFQQHYLIPYLTALENVMLAQYFHSIPDERTAREVLELVGLKNRLGHLPSQLSGGEQQRVCIARAVINEPKIILADEPTGSLDEENENMVMRIFAQLHNLGHTLLMVTHDTKIGDMAERKIKLDHGRVKQILEYNISP